MNMYYDFKNWLKTLALSAVLIGAYALLNAEVENAPRAASPAGNTGTTTSPSDIGAGAGNNTGTRPTTGAGLGSGTDSGDLSGNVPSGTGSSSIENNRGANTGSRFITADVNGVIQSIDTSGSMARVRVREANGQINEFVLDNDTSVFRNDSRVSASNLRAGDTVTLRRNVSATR